LTIGPKVPPPPNLLRSAPSFSQPTSPQDPCTRFPMPFRSPKRTRHT
jgi:hypothetical protein